MTTSIYSFWNFSGRIIYKEFCIIQIKMTITIDDDELRAEGISVRDLMFYVTLECNLRCKSCYVGNDWLNGYGGFGREEGLAIIDHFGSQGLDRLTFLGGEPTLHPDISDFVLKGAEFDIKERRMTTNGRGLGFFDIDAVPTSALHHISVSLDGHTPETNDSVRGTGTFEKVIPTLELLNARGFNAYVNYTVNGLNIDSVEDAVRYFRELGVEEINFHLVSITGNANHHPELYVAPERWIETRERLLSLEDVQGVRLRVPFMYLTQDEHEAAQGEGYVPFQSRSYHSDDGQRILLFPNGKVFMSADLVGTDFHIATYEDGKFTFNKGQNEWHFHKSNPLLADPSSQLLGTGSEGFVPVSISYKQTIQY